MWIQGIQQRGGQLGELAVEVVLNAPGQESERLQQALHVWVGTLGAAQVQPAGQRWVARGEGRARPAQVGQLAQVILAQLVLMMAVPVHAPLPASSHYKVVNRPWQTA